MLNREHLHGYQERAIEFIKTRKRCALFLFMGAGKSVSTLTAITDLLDSCMILKPLIIAPLRVANTVWKQEAENWQHTRHLNIVVVTGGEKQRLAALKRTADVYVINRENVRWLVNLYGQKWPFDFVAIDESSSFKSAASDRFKALKSIINKTDYITLLTGTPSPNGLIDLWSQFYLVDFGERLGRTLTGYKSRFFNSGGFGGYKLTPKPEAQGIIEKLIAPVVLSMTAEDHIELPDRIDLEVKVDIGAEAKRQYLELQREQILAIGDDIINPAHMAAVVGKLFEFCNGAMYSTPGSDHYLEMHKAKLIALRDIMDDNPDENVLVAYNFKSDRERILNAFPEAVVLDKDPETVRRWNNGEIRMLLANPASAGHGLNLQRGGALAIWFGLNWSLELYQQFNARLHRQGQMRPVRIIHLIAEGLLDERVMATLADKNATQQTLIESLKVQLLET